MSAGALGTYTLAGMGVGGVLAGRLSDRVGRLRVIRWAVVVFTICTGIIGFVQDYWQIAVMRFISGFGIAALYSLGQRRRRGVRADEDPHDGARHRAGRLVGRIRRRCAAGVVRAARRSAGARCSGAPSCPAWRRSLMLRGLTRSSELGLARRDVPAREGGRLLGLWNDPATRRNAVLWTFTSIALQFGYYGANTWLPSYLVKDLGVNLQSMGWYVAGTYTMMCVGKIITGYAADIFGQEGACGSPRACSPRCTFQLFVFYGTPSTIAYLLLVFGFLYGAPYAVNGTYMSESFPAAVRGTAVGARLQPRSDRRDAVAAAHRPTRQREYSIGFGLACSVCRIWSAR